MRRPRGAVNFVKLTLFVVVVSVAYLGWLCVPLWLDDLDVREAVATAVGQMYAENASSDTKIRETVAVRLASVGTHWEEQQGRQVEVPGLGVGPEDVELTRNPDERTGRVGVNYVRTVKLRPLDRYWSIQFHTAREGKLR